MKSKEKSTYLSTVSTKPNFRPNSAAVKRTYTGVRTTNLSTEVPPPIHLPVPSNPKKLQGMGNNMEKEELYKKVMDLKDYNNKLYKELQECKTSLVKKDIELKKKEKLLKECNKENDIQIVHEKKLEEAKESTLLTLCKQKYYELKKNYIKKCEENDNLKANIKITKIKEFQIENDILKSEMEKLRELYEFNRKEKEASLGKVKDLEELKDKFLEQHLIIKSYILKNEELSKKNNEFYSDINSMQNKLNKYEKEKKKMMIEREKMEKKLENYMANKKIKENLALKENDNMMKIVKLKRELEDYKRMYNQKESECKKLQQFSKGNLTGQTKELKPLNYKEFQQIASETKVSENGEKVSLLKSLLHEAQVKIGIYEDFIKSSCKKDPKDLLKSKGYEDILNSNCPPLILRSSVNNGIIKEVDDVSNKISNFNNDKIEKENVERELLYETKKSEDIYKKTTDKYPDTVNFMDTAKDNNLITDELNKVVEEDAKENREKNIEDFEKQLDNENNELNENPEEAGEKEFEDVFHVFIKNLEARHMTKEIMQQKVFDIITLFQNKEEATKEEFLAPINKMMVESMGVTIPEDIEFINSFFSKVIDKLDGDTGTFFNELMVIFNNIMDYNLISEQEEILNVLSKQLVIYKDSLLQKIKEKHKPKDDHVITFDTLRDIVKELRIILKDDLIEFLIYKMKETLNGSHSIFDLNTLIIENMFENLNKDINIENDDNIELLNDKIKS